MEEFYKGIALEGSENIWIMKPIGKSRGRGISLVNDISKVVYAEQVKKLDNKIKNSHMMNYNFFVLTFNSTLERSYLEIDKKMLYFCYYLFIIDYINVIFVISLKYFNFELSLCFII